jgi:hypothetical protein
MCIGEKRGCRRKKNESEVSKLHDFFCFFPFGRKRDDQRDNCTFHRRIRAIQREETIFDREKKPLKKRGFSHFSNTDFLEKFTRKACRALNLGRQDDKSR